METLLWIDDSKWAAARAGDTPAFPRIMPHQWTCGSLVGAQRGNHGEDASIEEPPRGIVESH